MGTTPAVLLSLREACRRSLGNRRHGRGPSHSRRCRQSAANDRRCVNQERIDSHRRDDGPFVAAGIGKPPGKRGWNMTAILYGNLSVEIAGVHGARIERATLRPVFTDLLCSQQPQPPEPPVMLGREQEAADAFAAIKALRPIGFHAPCGVGKTTLLRYVTSTSGQPGTGTTGVYLRADGDRVTDLLHQLVTKLYASQQPIKLTPVQCAQLLGQARTVVAIDDLSAGPDGVGYLLKVLPGCGVLIGSAQPVLSRQGSSRSLAGLSADAALALIARDLGRPLSSAELPAATRLAAAVRSQPLHLRQAAALVREGGQSFISLSKKAAHDPDILDRLSISALAQHERRALAVLSLTAGALLPANVVAVVGQIAYLGECLESLHRRGLAEQREDRFGLPVCKAESYLQLLLQDLDRAASARQFAIWLAARNPTASESQSAADAALAMLEYATGRGEWTTVARLARAAEAILFVAGRWEAWHHTLSRGLHAARAIGDRAAEAFFAHQHGTLAFCQDQLDDAFRLLQHALILREQMGDWEGAEVTRHNLQLLAPPQPPPAPRLRVRRRILVTLATLLGALALVAVAIAGATLAGRSSTAGKAAPASPPGPRRTTASPGPVTRDGPAGSGQGTLPISSKGSGQNSHSPAARSLRLTPATLAAEVAGAARTQKITAAGGSPPYTFAVSSGSLPPGLSLSAQGILAGTPTTPGTYQFTVTAADSSAPPRSGSQAYALTVTSPAAIILSPPSLPAATLGQPEAARITAAGGSPPYTFSVSSGSPPGLSLSAQGTLTGTPTTPGTYQFTVTAADSSAPPRSGSQAYALTVTSPAAIILSPPSLPLDRGCSPYDTLITATGGTPPYGFSVSSGTPSWLSLSPDGLLTGAPASAGRYQFTVTATDSSTAHRSGSQAYAISVDCSSTKTGPPSSAPTPPSGPTPMSPDLRHTGIGHG